MATKPLALDAESQAYLDFLEKGVGKDLLYAGILKLFDQQASLGAGFISQQYVQLRLRTRTGSLVKSVVGRGEMFRGVPGYRIGVLRGPAIAYAGVQDQGTQGKNADSPYPTIKPDGHPALAMPLEANLTPAGVVRRPIRSFPQKGQPGALHFIPFRSSGVAVGALYSPEEYKRMQQDRRKGRWALGSLYAYNALFLLLTEVDVAPTWWLRDGFEAWMPKVTEALANYLRDLLAGNGGKRVG